MSDLKEVRLVLPIVPPNTTSQMKRHNHATGAVFKGKAQRSAEDTVMGALLPLRVAVPLRSPVEVEIIATWPWRKGDGAKVRAKGPQRMTVKPDGDNFGKGIQDLLSSLRFIEGDSGVTDKIVRKRRGDDVGIVILIREVEA